MADGSDVVRKVLRFNRQLAATDEAQTVLKILQKLKDLDITIDILAETGIGKTVNALRRHEVAGELAKSLVRGWKKLVPKESSSLTEDGDAEGSVSLQDKPDQNYPGIGTCIVDDLNNNCININSKDTSNEFLVKKDRKTDSENELSKEKIQLDENGDKQDKKQKKNKHILENGTNKTQKDKRDHSAALKKKKSEHSYKRSGARDDVDRSKKSQDAKPDVREKLKSLANNGNFGREKESDEKSKSSKESPKKPKEPFSSSKYSKVFKEDGPSRKNRKRKKPDAEKHAVIKSKEAENNGSSTKKPKTKEQDRESGSDPEEPTMSFESYLNYDANVLKRKERCGAKKLAKTVKTVMKEEKGTKPDKPHIVSAHVTSSKKSFIESVMDVLDLPLTVNLPESENPSTFEYFERKAEKESDVGDNLDESAVFTGQRLNRKMQVYSGAKTIFLPAMMSLYQQCIRTLQNNINLLFETGGVPFEILEPVLERCTPEQLLRIEECNPIYIGVTDHLWGKHCQRDFKDSRLQEYESWKEMYIRLSEERERKLQRLTKSIVSAQSQRPKGRQVKMAFIHTVAKPPRDVRIQQEIHGTAVPQPHQPRCSVKVQETRSKSTCSESSSRSSSNTSSGTNNTQDPRKKTRVAPMMAKSLKQFKKQLGRR